MDVTKQLTWRHFFQKVSFGKNWASVYLETELTIKKIYMLLAFSKIWPQYLLITATFLNMHPSCLFSTGSNQLLLSLSNYLLFSHQTGLTGISSPHWYNDNSLYFYDATVLFVVAPTRRIWSIPVECVWQFKLLFFYSKFNSPNFCSFYFEFKCSINLHYFSLC